MILNSKIIGKNIYEMTDGVNTGGFSLIELLVVTSIAALFMALLMPSLQRVRRQAMAVVCQSNLRQIGITFELEKRYLPDSESGLLRSEHWWVGFRPNGDQSLYNNDSKGQMLCPIAKKLGKSILKSDYNPLQKWDGSKFYAWGRESPTSSIACSYGSNPKINQGWGHFNTRFLRQSPRVPLLFDCTTDYVSLDLSSDLPPAYDDMPASTAVLDAEQPGCKIAINRHDGSINMLNLDHSVRKVGLKELWTLKWNKYFNPAGPWTIAGGVQPGDWPEWMRNFKDY